MNVPLEQRDALTLREAASLGYASQRTLREMISKGVLKNSVLRVGKRGKRLLRTVMIEELQAHARRQQKQKTETPREPRP